MTGHGRPVDSAIFPHPHALAAICARRFGVTPSMIEAAALRRAAGDWRGAGAAAAVSIHLDPVAVRRRHGAEVAALLRSDLLHLSPDLLRWHFPRARHGVGRLLEAEWVPLADYAAAGAPLTLVAWTPREALAAGQRIVLTLLEGSRRRVGRQNLTRHRMFWDATAAPGLARLAAELGANASAAARQITAYQDLGQVEQAWEAAGIELRTEPSRRMAALPVNLPVLVAEARHALPGVDRAAIPFSDGVIALRGLVSEAGPVAAELLPPAQGRELPVIPMAAWARPVDAELLRLDLLGARELHPLVAAALAPGTPVTADARGTRDLLYVTVPGFEAVSDAAILVRCGAELHRVAWRDGRWQPEHDEQAAREALLSRLGGAAHPCRQAAQYLSTGRHVLDLVDALVAHGRVDEVLQVVREHVDTSADPRKYVLGDGTTLGTALDALRTHTVRLQAHLAGFTPRDAFRVPPRDPRIRRTSRKGAPARLKKR